MPAHTSPLRALEETFRLLPRGPGQPQLNVATAAGLAPARLEPAQVARLLAQALGPVRDEVWRRLLRRARDEGGTWIVIALGLALPGLGAVVRRWGRHHAVAREDLAADVLAEALLCLQRLDLEAPRVCRRVCAAGEVAARRHVYRRQREHRRIALVAAPEPRTETRAGAVTPAGHPEHMLTRAVRAGGWRGGRADRAHTSGAPNAAAELGWAYGSATWRRRVAEQRLTAWLRAAECHGRLRAVWLRLG